MVLVISTERLFRILQPIIHHRLPDVLFFPKEKTRLYFRRVPIIIAPKKETAAKIYPAL